MKTHSITITFMMDGSTSPVGFVIWLVAAGVFNVFMFLLHIAFLHFGWM